MGLIQRREGGQGCRRGGDEEVCVRVFLQAFVRCDGLGLALGASIEAVESPRMSILGLDCMLSYGEEDQAKAHASQAASNNPTWFDEDARGSFI
jgi:hypothetical protein